jgi:IstB-like ATP binding protein
MRIRSPQKRSRYDRYTCSIIQHSTWCINLACMSWRFRELESSGDATTLTHAEWLGLLREVTYRNEKRLLARLRHAKLRHQAVIENIDYRAPRGLDRALFNKHRLVAGTLEKRWNDA